MSVLKAKLYSRVVVEYARLVLLAMFTLALLCIVQLFSGMFFGYTEFVDGSIAGLQVNYHAVNGPVKHIIDL